jgi:MFS family permease
MYQVEAWSALRGFWREPSRAARWGVAANVIALGVTSLFTDISSEMVATVLPVYLVVQLGLTPLQFGFVEGLYQGLTALFSLLSGVAADRWRRHKEIAAAGYGISAFCRIGMIAAGSAWPLIAGVVALDRFGKGIRTAPRDALISMSSDRASRGIAFGIHRAFDSAGAMLGPLAGLLILSALPQRFDVVFVVSFSIALVGLGVLLTFVRNCRVAEQDARAGVAVWRGADVRAIAPLLVAAAVLGAATVSDAFIYLTLQRSVGFNAVMLPLLYVGTSAVYLVLAMPFGRFADRAGRRITLLGGHLLLASTYLVAGLVHGGTAAIAATILLLGAYYAMTDGVFMALASAVCRSEQVATGMAMVTTVTSAGRFAAALAFGAVWVRFGIPAAVLGFSSAAVCAVVIAAAVFRDNHA